MVLWQKLPRPSCKNNTFLEVESNCSARPTYQITACVTELRRIIILYTANAKQPTYAKIIGLPTLYRLYRHGLASTKYDKLHQN